MVQKSGTKKKILVVEDEKMLSEMYFDKFSESGFKVFTAVEAAEGIEIAKKEKPDLIVLDILLPRENGIAFLRVLRKETKISSIPVVVLSNFDSPEIKKEAFGLGVLDYLIKTNYTPSKTVEKIRSYIDDKRNGKNSNKKHNSISGRER